MKPSDLSVILNGLEIVARAFVKINGEQVDKFYRNSSLRTISKSVVTSAEETFSSVLASTGEKNVAVHIAKEIKERSSVVTESIKVYSAYVANQGKPTSEPVTSTDFDIDHPVIHEIETLPSDYRQNINTRSAQPTSTPLDSKLKDVPNDSRKQSMVTGSIQNTKASVSTDASSFISSEKPNLASVAQSIVHVVTQPKLPKTHQLQKLSERARERKVPSSRIGRAMSFGNLAVGITLGAIAEATRQGLGLKSGNSADQDLPFNSVFFCEENAEKVVNTLCTVRGAALKLGQMLSIQDNAMINPKLAEVFERVRQSADFMPSWQMEKVLRKEFGNEWRSLFSEFEPKPFAAASIGQVHRAKLLDGKDAAMKIQYPGVAEGIESDIKNIMSFVNYWDLLPKGLYLENVIAVAKRELKKEVNYINEAKYGKMFKKMLEPYPYFFIPEVYDDLCTSTVLTTELVYGTPIDKLIDASQQLRNEVCEKLLELCLMEIFLFRFMQTDPNWSNFLYNFDSQQIVLLDFGACNEYTPEFVDIYMNIIKAAADRDRADVLEFSQKLGFLTGYETKVMKEAHVDAVMILGEAFACEKPFNFQQQNMTLRIHNLVPIMLKDRLTPPPEATYSLHRKMSGIFLLCAKLGAVIDCRKLFDGVYERYCANKSA